MTRNIKTYIKINVRINIVKKLKAIMKYESLHIESEIQNIIKML